MQATNPTHRVVYYIQGIDGDQGPFVYDVATGPTGKVLPETVAGWEWQITEDMKVKVQGNRVNVLSWTKYDQ